MSREDPQLKLRLTEEMKTQIAENARINGRSVNAEIVARLEWSLERAHQERSEAEERLASKDKEINELKDKFYRAEINLEKHKKRIDQEKSQNQGLTTIYSMMLKAHDASRTYAANAFVTIRQLTADIELLGNLLLSKNRKELSGDAAQMLETILERAQESKLWFIKQYEEITQVPPPPKNLESTPPKNQNE